MIRSRASSRLALFVAVAIILLGTATCVGEQANRGRRNVSRVSNSRVLYADSNLGPLKPTQALQIVVNASATYDSLNMVWTYSYTVTNDPLSSSGLETFGLTPMWKPVGITSPPHWIGFHSSDGDSNAVVWGVRDAGPAPPGWEGYNVYPSVYAIGPGQALSGFQIVSRQGPAPMSFFAQGFDSLPWGGEQELPSPPTVFQEGVAGTTFGPDKNSVVGVGNSPASVLPRVEFRAPRPNPSSSTVTLAYYLETGGTIKLDVYDVQGRLVANLDHGQKQPGLHSTTWNGRTAGGRPAAAGVYFYRLTVNGKSVGDRKTVLIK